MIMPLSKSLLDTAKRLIKQDGQNVQFDRVVNGSFNPVNGQVGTGVHTGYYAYGVQQPTPTEEVNGTTTLENDLILWVEVNNFNYIPQVGDVATLGTQAYRVLAVTQTILQGVTLLYKLQLRI